MVTWNLVNIGSGIVLVPDGTKPIPELMLTYHKSCGIQQYIEGKFADKVLKISIILICCTITYL